MEGPTDQNRVLNNVSKHSPEEDIAITQWPPGSFMPIKRSQYVDHDNKELRQRRVQLNKGVVNRAGILPPWNVLHRGVTGISTNAPMGQYSVPTPTDPPSRCTSQG